MADAPAVSVCIPTYNYGRFLGRAIESVLAQSFEDFELLVVDNASTDDTDELVASYDDPRLSYVRNERNLGLFGNFERCLELARSDLVKILCADDWLHPDYLAEGVPIMRAHPNVGLLSCASYLVDADGRIFGAKTAAFGRRTVIPAEEALRAQADYLNIIDMPSNTIFRREAALAAGGFDPAFTPASDLHLWLKLLCSYDLGWLPDPRCYLRYHETKEHGYAPDPTESNFSSWEDAARLPGTRIDHPLLTRAIDAEAERSVLYIVGRFLEGRKDEARAILRYSASHVSWPRALARFARRLPLLVRNELARRLALRSSRMVVYEPWPRVGRPIADVPPPADVRELEAAPAPTAGV